MPDNQNKREQSPADIARQAFHRLAARRIAPTPDAYREIYDEIVGTKQQPLAEKVLAGFAARLMNSRAAITELAHQLSRALEARDWEACSECLNQLVGQHLERPLTPSSRVVATADHADAYPVKAHSIPLVDETEPADRKTRLIAMVDALEPVELVDSPTVPPGGPKHTRLLREMLTRTWALAVVSLLYNAPELEKEAKALAESVTLARTEETLNEISARLKQLCFKIEMKSGDMAEEQELLLRLFRLLLENIGELVEDDSWLSGQVASVQELLSGPVDHSALMHITSNLKEIIYKQGLLKHSLNEAKTTLKNMMLTFVDRLEAFTVNTGDYHEKIEQYSQQIGNAQNVVDLNKVLDRVMFDTRVAQTEARRSCDQMIAVRQDVRAAEAHVHELQTRLVQMSEQVYEDQLTASLNRRGLDDVLERAFSRAERRNLPLCVSLLDIDDFKRLNDTHGHSAGDGALVHLVQVVKDTLRAMDVIGRFGGEEFLIVLPDTELEDAAQVVTRLQRELTKRIFMHNHERILITFSAGVALRAPNEDQATLIKRADEALYKAKKAGKNRVVSAQ
jgi:diguanylate cyclase